MNKLSNVNSINDDEKSLIGLNTALKIVNTNPQLYCFDRNFKLVELSKCQDRVNDRDLINKIMATSIVVISNPSTCSIKPDRWETILENVKAFVQKTDSLEAKAIGEEYLHNIPVFLKSGYLPSMVKELLTADIKKYRQSNINDAEHILSYISNERHITNYIMFCHIVSTLEQYFYAEFLHLGGTLQEKEGYPDQFHLCFKDLKINSPECASIALNLQTKFHEGNLNEVFNALEDYTNQFEHLESDSKKVVKLWQLYVLHVECGRAEDYFHMNELENNEHFQQLLQGKYPFFTPELKNLFEQFELDRNFSHLTIEGKSKGKKVYYAHEAELDKYNGFLSAYNEKKEEIDATYAKLHEKLKSVKLVNSNSDSEICEAFNFAMWTDPSEFSKGKMLSIDPPTLREFFKNRLLPNLGELISKPESHLFQLIWEELFLTKSTSKQYEDFLITSNSLFFKEVAKNKTYFKELKETQTKEFRNYALIKLSEFEMLAKKSEERQRINAQHIADITERTSKLSISKKKSNIRKTTALTVRTPARGELFSVYEEYNQFREVKINILKQLLIDENQIDVFSIHEIINELQTAPPNLLSSSLQDIFREICTNEEIIQQLEKVENQKTPILIKPKETSASNEFDIPRNPKTKKQRSPTEANKRKKARRRPHKKEVEETEGEKEKEKEIIREKPRTRSFIPLEPHQLFSIKQIQVDDRVSRWFLNPDNALSTPSYSYLGRTQKEEQKLFHSHPLGIAKIALMWGSQSYWTPNGDSERRNHTSLPGQIEVYEEGKEATYNGVFTDCYDSKNPNLLFHHHFSQRDFNSLIEDSTNNRGFQAIDELRRESQESNGVAQQTREFLDDSERFVIDQRPGLVTIDDTVKKIRYTVILSNKNK